MAFEFLKPSKAVKAHTIGNKQSYAQALTLFQLNNRHLQVAAHPFDQQITLLVFGSITMLLGSKKVQQLMVIQ